MSNSIWKTGSPKGIHEEDRLGDYYVAEFHREDGSSFYEAGGTCDICGIPDRWTFLTDLIAQADKAERLQEALCFIRNIRGAGMSYQDMFLDAHEVAKTALDPEYKPVLCGRYDEEMLDKIKQLIKGE